MDSAAFEWILNLLLAHGYFILFLTMLIEGPIVTFAAGFASSLGYFHIMPVLILSFLGDFVSDVVLYGVGHWGRHGIAERYGHRVGLTKERMEHIEVAMKRHIVKSLIIFKFVPVLPTFGLIAAGSVGVPFKKFLTVVTLVIIPRTIFFGLLGYYAGEAYQTILPKVEAAQYKLLVLIIVTTALFMIYKAVSDRISAKTDL